MDGHDLQAGLPQADLFQADPLTEALGLDCLVEVLGHACGYLPAVRAVCRAWQWAVNAAELWSDEVLGRHGPGWGGPALGLRCLAEGGRTPLLEWALAARADVCAGLPEYDSNGFPHNQRNYEVATGYGVMVGAARGGFPDLAVWGAGLTGGDTVCTEAMSAFAAAGHEEGMRALRPFMGRGFYGGRRDAFDPEESLDVELSEALAAAAGAGQEAAAALLQEWGARSYTAAVKRAAGGGHAPLVLTLLAWGRAESPKYEQDLLCAALRAATKGGHAELARHAKTELESLLECEELAYPHLAAEAAARSGHEDTVRLARRWGAADPDSMLRAAARGGHTALCRTARDCWGATKVDAMLENAARGGHTALCDLAREWGARSLGPAACAAARGGHTGLVESLMGLIRQEPAVKGTVGGQDWACEVLGCALVRAAEGGHWGTCEELFWGQGAPPESCGRAAQGASDPALARELRSWVPEVGHVGRRRYNYLWLAPMPR
jgi:hypothetical protein